VLVLLPVELDGSAFQQPASVAAMAHAVAEILGAGSGRGTATVERASPSHTTLRVRVTLSPEQYSSSARGKLERATGAGAGAEGAAWFARQLRAHWPQHAAGAAAPPTSSEVTLGAPSVVAARMSPSAGGARNSAHNAAVRAASAAAAAAAAAAGHVQWLRSGLVAPAAGLAVVSIFFAVILSSRAGGAARRALGLDGSGAPAAGGAKRRVHAERASETEARPLMPSYGASTGWKPVGGAAGSAGGATLMPAEESVFKSDNEFI
jgi:hypothetical protein